LLDALNGDRCPVVMAAREHRVGLGRDKVAHLDLARTGDVTVYADRVLVVGVDLVCRHFDLERQDGPAVDANPSLSLLTDHDRRGICP
jgi:hypothetical protein